VLIWYYAAISMVNVIYGSIAITVVALLSIEVVTIILLLGAQVIAELEHKPDESAKEEHPGFETLPCTVAGYSSCAVKGKDCIT
jgi:uncharacterized BrkB/YihY/UPF0761 family membrane protein